MYTLFLLSWTVFLPCFLFNVYSCFSKLKNHLLQAAFSGLLLAPLSSRMIMCSYIPMALSYNGLFNLLSFLLNSIIGILILFYSYYPAECLAYTWYLINMCWMHEWKQPLLSVNNELSIVPRTSYAWPRLRFPVLFSLYTGGNSVLE